jgi:hypothetical protein
MWGWNWLNDLAKDLKYTIRMMRSNLLFTVVVVALALGIGAKYCYFQRCECGFVPQSSGSRQA